MMAGEITMQAPHTLLEISLRRNQADHQETVAWEVEKMSWVHEYIAPFEQRHRKILIRTRRGDTQHRVPSSLAFQPIDRAAVA